MARPAHDSRIRAGAIWGRTPHVMARGRGSITLANPNNYNQRIFETQTGNIGWHFGAGYTNEVDSDFVPTTNPADQPYLQISGQNVGQVLAFPGNDTIDTTNIVRYRNITNGLGVSFTLQPLQFINELSQIQQISTPANVAPSVIQGDLIRWNGAFGSGLDFVYEAQTARLSKKIIINDFGFLPALAIGGNVELNAQYFFQPDPGIGLFVNGLQWDQQTTTEVFGPVEFRNLATGRPICYFGFPWAVAFDGLGLSTRFLLRRQGNNLLAQARVPYSQLQAAIYPVQIDPTIDEQVGASTDDGYSDSGVSAATLTDTEYYIGDGQISSPRRAVGVRFQTVAVESATINLAYLSAAAVFTGTLDVPVRIVADDVDDAAAWATTPHLVNQITETTANIDNHSSKTYTINVLTRIPSDSNDISSVVQELINRPGWASGQDMRFLMIGNGSTAYTAKNYISYDGSTSLCPTLHIEYTTGGSTGTGDKFPASNTTASESPYVSNDWVNPGNIYADDSNLAEVVHPTFDTDDYTYVLYAYNFDFSGIPAGSTIDGVICKVNTWFSAGGAQSNFVLMQLLDTGLNRVGTNQCATPVTMGSSTTDIITKGTSADKWGNSLTASWVKNSNFGVALAIQAKSDNQDVHIDYVTLEVYYTAPAGGAGGFMTAQRGYWGS